jgi:hypothetical protein
MLQILKDRWKKKTKVQQRSPLLVVIQVGRAVKGEVESRGVWEKAWEGESFIVDWPRSQCTSPVGQDVSEVASEST